MCGKLRKENVSGYGKWVKLGSIYRETESKQVLVDGVGDDFKNGIAHGDKYKIVGVDD